jgi:transcriptional regulator with XRE-family HTH domain
MTVLGSRRTELAQFLRSRRARLSPADVGLAPGLRRRTPGLRREEVAQLAGVGVTWYTWLEQGRPINASVQILDAVARTLRLDAAERAHLYRLAEIPVAPDPAAPGECLHDEVQAILDSMQLVPAVVYNGRYDVLAWNCAYAAVFPDLVNSPPELRNVLWHLFVAEPCCRALVNADEELPRMVATLRAGFGRHLGEPAWTGFVRRLSAASPRFAGMWAEHDVAVPGSRIKIFQHLGDGQLLRTMSTAFAISSAPECRMVAYPPVADEDRHLLARVLAGEQAPNTRCAAHRAA